MPKSRCCLSRATGGVVYMTKPLDRPEVLLGHTYKIKWLDSDHAFYITINDIEKDGRRRPFEIFINSKNMEAYAWTLALTRMISAVFRRGGDVSFVVDELKAVFDPRGGQWMAGALCAVPAGRHRRGDRAAHDRHRLHAPARDLPLPEKPAPSRRKAGARSCPRCSAQLREAGRLRHLPVLRLFAVRMISRVMARKCGPPS